MQPTPTATPTPPPAGWQSSGPPQAPVPGSSGGGAVVVNGAVEEIVEPAAPQQPLGNLPLWGAAAAGFLGLWAAYARRKRLQRAWEEARERARRAAWDAADRARRLALSLAVARDQAEKAAAEAQQELDDAILTAKEEHLGPDLPPYTPPPNSPEAALLDGALIVPGKTPTVERDLPPQHTAPPWDHGAGAYQPDVEGPPSKTQEQTPLWKKIVALPFNIFAAVAYTTAYQPYHYLAHTYPRAHQSFTQVVNYFLLPVKSLVYITTNTTDPNTMTWWDIGKIWLFELHSPVLAKTSPPIITFDPQAKVTQEVMDLEGVQQLRMTVIQDIENGNGIETMPECQGFNHCLRWFYRVSDYFHSLPYVAQGSWARFYLGSYQTYAKVYSNLDGTYTIEYVVENESSLESFTRLSQDFSGFWPENAQRGEGIKLGGTIKMRFYWAETYTPEN